MVIDRALLLAGGMGTRLGLVSRAINKHCNIVYKQPMILYPLMNIKECGIENICIVTSEVSANNIIQIIRDGREFGVDVNYKFQTHADGIAGAIKLTEKFIDDKPFLVILGDNFYYPMPTEEVENYSGVGAKIVLKATNEPHKYGIALFNKIMWYKYDEKEGTIDVQAEYDQYGNFFDTMDIDTFRSKYSIVGVEEKPKTNIGNLLAVGMYMYDKDIWEILDSLSPSKRGELEISSVNSRYIGRGEATYSLYNGEFLDCGEPEGLLEASKFVKSKEDYYNKIAGEWNIE